LGGSGWVAVAGGSVAVWQCGSVAVAVAVAVAVVRVAVDWVVGWLSG
jgi:hypothetical protein